MLLLAEAQLLACLTALQLKSPGVQPADVKHGSCHMLHGL